MTADPHEERKVNWDGVEVSAADALAFLNEKGQEKPCPHCGEENWAVAFSPGEGLFAYLPQRTMASEGDRRYQGVYNVVCLTCGYMQMHALSVLADWKRNVIRAQNDG